MAMNQMPPQAYMAALLVVLVILILIWFVS